MTIFLKSLKNVTMLFLNISFTRKNVSMLVGVELQDSHARSMVAGPGHIVGNVDEGRRAMNDGWCEVAAERWIGWWWLDAHEAWFEEWWWIHRGGA